MKGLSGFWLDVIVYSGILVIAIVVSWLVLRLIWNSKSNYRDINKITYEIDGDLVIKKWNIDIIKLIENGINYRADGDNIYIDNKWMEYLDSEYISYKIQWVVVDIADINISKLNNNNIEYSVVGDFVKINIGEIGLNKLWEYSICDIGEVVENG